MLNIPVYKANTRNNEKQFETRPKHEKNKNYLGTSALRPTFFYVISECKHEDV